MQIQKQDRLDLGFPECLVRTFYGSNVMVENLKLDNRIGS